jgi:hypothetical protein
MAATDPNLRSQEPRQGGAETLPAGAMDERLDEEIARAERHGTGLSCLLVLIEEGDGLEFPGELPANAIDYVAAAVRRELRRFDRVGRASERELLILLPGAGSPLGEVVARRVLERLRTIKVEAQGARRPLQVSLGLAAWSRDMTAPELIARARAAARRQNGEEDAPSPALRELETGPGEQLRGRPGHPPPTISRGAPS